jgi:hypothetical protein
MLQYVLKTLYPNVRVHIALDYISSCSAVLEKSFEMAGLADILRKGFVESRSSTGVPPGFACDCSRRSGERGHVTTSEVSLY